MLTSAINDTYKMKLNFKIDRKFSQNFNKNTISISQIQNSIYCLHDLH